jgi:hypothetical protein
MNHEEVEKVAHDRRVGHSVGTYDFRRHAERLSRLSIPTVLCVVQSNPQRRALESYAPEPLARWPRQSAYQVLWPSAHAAATKSP